MAENFNCNVSGSKCGNGSSLSDANTTTCDKYGRLYDWATAMGLASTCNSTICASQVQAKHKGVCPTGWYIPSGDDWNVLISFIHEDKGLGSFIFNSGSGSAGKYLKATSGWDSYGSIAMASHT
jgi:uncharacterized protein (TIGR02145 family)